MELKNNPNAIATSINEPFLLALISEELKSRRLFSTLQQVGLDGSPYQPTLDALIMQGLGLAEDNATLELYFTIMDEHAASLPGVSAGKSFSEEVAAQTKEVFARLVAGAAELKNRPEAAGC